MTTAGAVSAEDAGPLVRFLRWCGLALVTAGVLMVVATLLHPSRETATTIVASEPRLVAAHTVYTVAWLLLLLGVPGLYATQRGGMGPLALPPIRPQIELPVAALGGEGTPNGHERVDREAPVRSSRANRTRRDLKRGESATRNRTVASTTVVPVYSSDCLRAAVPSSKIRLAS